MIGGTLAAIARRLAWSAAVLGFVVTLTFIMVTAIPADPARALVGAHADADTLARARAHYCLDRSTLDRFGCFVGDVATGDLGESFRLRRPVADVIAERAWPTAQLALAALALQLALGIPLGVWSATRRGRWPDRLGSALTLLGASTPTFLVGTLAVYLLAFLAGWFPIAGYGDGMLDRLHHLVLPAMTLATGGVAAYARLTRAEVHEQLQTDHVRTARAKGLPEALVVRRHALRPAWPALLTVAGLDLGLLLGGAVVTEAIFAWPGLGRELLLAVLALDLPLILGATLVCAAAIVAVDLAVDVALGRLDPRMRAP
jgi:peptide/nickel transport system permease protein